MILVVGRLGRPHGIKGDITVEVRTDSPEERFAPGSKLQTDPADLGPLTVERAQWHSGRLLVHFAGFDDRQAAERLRNVFVIIESDDLEPLPDPDEFYDHQLIGLTAHTVSGDELGTVTDVLHGPAGDILVIARTAPEETPDGSEQSSELLVPFLLHTVPTVDLASRQVIIDPPAGLLDL